MGQVLWNNTVRIFWVSLGVPLFSINLIHRLWRSTSGFPKGKMKKRIHIILGPCTDRGIWQKRSERTQIPPVHGLKSGPLTSPSVHSKGPDPRFYWSFERGDRRKGGRSWVDVATSSLVTGPLLTRCFLVSTGRRDPVSGVPLYPMRSNGKIMSSNRKGGSLGTKNSTCPSLRDS